MFVVVPERVTGELDDRLRCRGQVLGWDDELVPLRARHVRDHLASVEEGLNSNEINLYEQERSTGNFLIELWMSEMVK